MSARHKLNEIAIQSSLITAGIVGLAFESWLAFVIATAIFISLSLNSGEIRPNGADRTRTSKSDGRRPRFPRADRR